MATHGPLTRAVAFAVLMQAHMVPSSSYSESTVGVGFVCQDWDEINASMSACEQYHSFFPRSHMFERLVPGTMKRPYDDDDDDDDEEEEEECEPTGAENQCIFPAGKRRTRKRYQKRSPKDDDAYFRAEASTTQAVTSEIALSLSGSTRTSHMSTSESGSENHSLDSDEVSSDTLDSDDVSSDTDTRSDAADADDTSSIYSSSEGSTSSDDTDAVVQRAIEGRLGEDFDELPEGEITRIRAGNMPKFSFDQFKNSPVASILPEFLAQMEAADKELKQEKAAGTLDARRLEIDETEDGAESGQYIEMNLGLGVLEEKTGETSSSDSENSEGEGQSVMQKLMGVKAKNDIKKAKIEEV